MLLSKLVGLWETADSLEIIRKRPVDMIVAITYGIMPDRLPDSTKFILLEAISFKKRFPHAVLVLCNVGYIFPGSALLERKLKEEILRKASLVNGVVWGNDINNSVQEKNEVKKIVEKINPKCILLVTCQMHTRSVKLIYEGDFQMIERLLFGVSWKHEAQKDHPVKVQRSHWKWFLANVARQTLLRISMLIFGDFRLLEQLHHRSNIQTRG